MSDTLSKTNKFLYLPSSNWFLVVSPARRSEQSPIASPPELHPQHHKLFIRISNSNDTHTNYIIIAELSHPPSRSANPPYTQFVRVEAATVAARVALATHATNSAGGTTNTRKTVQGFAALNSRNYNAMRSLRKSQRGLPTFYSRCEIYLTHFATRSSSPPRTNSHVNVWRSRVICLACLTSTRRQLVAAV